MSAINTREKEGRMPTRIPATDMIAIEITARYPTLRYRKPHLEAWEARTLDHTWIFRRLEVPGTPWEAENTVTGQYAPTWFSTLDEARAWVHKHTEDDRS